MPDKGYNKEELIKCDSDSIGTQHNLPAKTLTVTLKYFSRVGKPTQMQKKLKSLYTDPLYRNSIALMLNSAFAAFFGLLFWIVAARTMPAKDIGLATAAISAAALIVGLSKLGLDAGLPDNRHKIPAVFKYFYNTRSIE